MKHRLTDGLAGVQGVHGAAAGGCEDEEQGGGERVELHGSLGPSTGSRSGN